MTNPAQIQTPNARGPIAQLWERDDAERQPILDRVRLCAAMTKPWILPPKDHDPNRQLPQNFQSIGSRGIVTMGGKMLVALFPVDEPWFDYDVAGEIIADPTVTNEVKQDQRDQLFLQKLVILSKLESSDIDEDEDSQGASPFRTAKRDTIDQLLVTGDVCEQFTDDYEIKVFRRDQYVVKRDSRKRILYIVVKESVDPLALTKTQQTLAKLPEGWLEKPVCDRMVDIYTRAEWNPRKKKWVIEQEINANTVNISIEPVSPFFVTPYELTAGENYGRGFVEINLGDLSSLDKLGERELDYAALASKLLAAIDYGSEVREEDLAKKTGSTFRARVEGGVIQDVGFLNVGKHADMSIVFEKTANLRKELGGAMLLESEVTPQKERTTATQVLRVAREVDQALGGAYAPIADHQQRPLLRRLLYQLRRDKLLPKLPKGTVEIRLLTGLAALARANKAADLQGFIGAMAAFPETAKRLDQGILARILVRYSNINEPGLVKSDEQMAKELQQAIAAQMQAAAGEKAIDTVGNVIEANATQPRQGGPAATPA